MKLHRYVDHQRLHIVTKDVISLSISVLLLFRHYISHKITFGAPSSGGVLCSACGAFILISRPKHMLWVLKRSFEHPKHMIKLMGKKNLTILCSNFLTIWTYGIILCPRACYGFNCDVCLFVCLFSCFTSQVYSYGHGGTVSSPYHTFSWAGLKKRLISNSCTYFRL